MSAKWQVTVITPRPSRPFGFTFKDGPKNNGRFEHQVLDSYTCPKSTLLGRMRESYSFGKHVVQYISKNHNRVKCIYVLAWPLLAQFLIVRAARKYAIPSVTHIMDIYPESLISRLSILKRISYSLLLPLDKFILQNSSRVITISSGMKAMLVKSRMLNDQNVEIIPNWQNDQGFIDYYQSGHTGHHNSPFTFMFLGSLSAAAAIEVIISAYTLCGLKEARLVIAGNGSEKERLIAMAKTCKNQSIEFWEAPLNNVPEIQDQADVLILSLRKNTSHYAMPSKLPAYMFSKKPVIACAEGESDIAQAILQANCGWVVPPEDKESLAQIMTECISVAKQELQTLGENGFVYAMENYARDKNLNKLIALIKQAAEV